MTTVRGIDEDVARPVLAPRPAAYGLTAVLVAVAWAAATASYLAPSLVGGPAVIRGNLRGTAAVLMCVGLPLLAATVLTAARGSTRAVVVWLGTVAYVLYQSLMFTFGTPFNRLFLVYVAMLSLALWSLVVLWRQVDVDALGEHVVGALPARRLSAYAAAVAALNALAWLGRVVPATFDDHPGSLLAGSGMTTNPVYVQDLAVWLPLLLAGAWWLWHGSARGLLVVGAMLVMLELEAVSVAVDQVYGVRAQAGTPYASLAGAWLFAGVAVVGLVPLWAFFRHLDAPPPSAGSRLPLV